MDQPNPQQPTQPVQGSPVPTSSTPTPQSTGDQTIDEIMAMEPKEVPSISPQALAASQTADGRQMAAQESKRIRWKCRNCGYQYEGYKKLNACPHCGKDTSYFEDVE